MDALTVRRWIEEPIADVWRRVTDLDALVAREHALDLVDLEGSDGQLEHGTVAVLSRRHGPRVTTMELHVVTLAAPVRMVLSLARGTDRWVITVELAALSTTVTDVTIQAHRDPSSDSLRLRAPGRGGPRHGSGDLADVLEAFGRAAEVRPQRMDTGR